MDEFKPHFQLRGWLPKSLLGFVPRRDPDKLTPHGTVTPEVIEEVKREMAYTAHADPVAKKHGISRALVWMIQHGNIR